MYNFPSTKIALKSNEPQEMDKKDDAVESKPKKRRTKKDTQEEEPKGPAKTEEASPVEEAQPKAKSKAKAKGSPKAKGKAKAKAKAKSKAKAATKRPATKERDDEDDDEDDEEEESEEETEEGDPEVALSGSEVTRTRKPAVPVEIVPVTTLADGRDNNFQEALETAMDEIEKKDQTTPEESEKDLKKKDSDKKEQPKEVTPSVESQTPLDTQDTATWPLGDNWMFHFK